MLFGANSSDVVPRATLSSYYAYSGTATGDSSRSASARAAAPKWMTSTPVHYAFDADPTVAPPLGPAWTPFLSIAANPAGGFLLPSPAVTPIPQPLPATAAPLSSTHRVPAELNAVVTAESIRGLGSSATATPNHATYQSHEQVVLVQPVASQDDPGRRDASPNPTRPTSYIATGGYGTSGTAQPPAATVAPAPNRPQPRHATAMQGSARLLSATVLAPSTTSNSVGPQPRATAATVENFSDQPSVVYLSRPATPAAQQKSHILSPNREEDPKLIDRLAGLWAHYTAQDSRDANAERRWRDDAPSADEFRGPRDGGAMSSRPVAAWPSMEGAAGWSSTNIARTAVTSTTGAYAERIPLRTRAATPPSTPVDEPLRRTALRHRRVLTPSPAVLQALGGSSVVGAQWKTPTTGHMPRTGGAESAAMTAPRYQQHASNPDSASYRVERNVGPDGEVLFVASVPLSSVHGSASRRSPPHIGRAAVPLHVRESLRVLEERERSHRETLRFLEAQHRKGVLVREEAERPTMQTIMWGSMYSAGYSSGSAARWGAAPAGNDYHGNHSRSHSRERPFWSPAAASPTRALPTHSAFHGPPGGALDSSSLENGAPPSVAPSVRWRALDMSPRDARQSPLVALASRESDARQHLVDAERDVRCAVVEVIRGLDRQAHAAQARDAHQRRMLVLRDRETQERQKLVELEQHIFKALSDLHRGAHKAVIESLYQRAKLYASSCSHIQREESKRRLEVVDDEVLHRRRLMVAHHEDETALLEQQSRHRSAWMRDVQRFANAEGELRFGLLQEEDAMRNEKYTRWAHEKTVLEHVDRQRYQTQQIRLSKMAQMGALESAVRAEVAELEQSLRHTLESYLKAFTARHETALRQTYEREWREALCAETRRRLLHVNDAEEVGRAEVLRSWDCVVKALYEWQGELSLQYELELSFLRRKDCARRLMELEEAEAAARHALIFAFDAVLAQHREWSREVRTGIVAAWRQGNARSVARFLEAEAHARVILHDAEQQRRDALVEQAKESKNAARLTHAVVMEDDGRRAIEVVTLRSLRTVLEQEALERGMVRQHDLRTVAAEAQRQLVMETYVRTEAESRDGIWAQEGEQWVHMRDAKQRDLQWLRDAELRAFRERQKAIRALVADETAARDELENSEAAVRAELAIEEDKEKRRAVEEIRAAARLLSQQFRTSALTLFRLEEVNRDVLRGAEARGASELERRLVDLHKRFEEEHARLLRVMEQRRRRTLEEKLAQLLDDEAISRDNVLRIETDVWEHHIMSAFVLRSPVVVSNTPQAAALIAREAKERTELHDLFHYERWNLVDLEHMSRDDIADGVQPPTYRSHPNSRAPSAATSMHADASFSRLAEPRASETVNSGRAPAASHWRPERVSNDFAVVAEADVLLLRQAHRETIAEATSEWLRTDRATAARGGGGTVALPPHPTAWEFDDVTASPPRRVPSSSEAFPSPPVNSHQAAPLVELPTPHRDAMAVLALARRKSGATIVDSRAAPPTGPGSLPVPAGADAPSANSNSSSAPRALADRLSWPSTTPPVAAASRYSSTAAPAVPPQPSSAWFPQGPASRAQQSTGATAQQATLDYLVQDLIFQESEKRKLLLQSQYQLVAQIIQHNIDTLPES